MSAALGLGLGLAGRLGVWRRPLGRVLHAALAAAPCCACPAELFVLGSHLLWCHPWWHCRTTHPLQSATNTQPLLFSPHAYRYGPSGSADVMGHAFFKQIDWRKLEARQVGGLGAQVWGDERAACVHASLPRSPRLLRPGHCCEAFPRARR